MHWVTKKKKMLENVCSNKENRLILTDQYVDLGSLWIRAALCV